jgi:hypothetical protein
MYEFMSVQMQVLKSELKEAEKKGKRGEVFEKDSIQAEQFKNTFITFISLLPDG